VRLAAGILAAGILLAGCAHPSAYRVTWEDNPGAAYTAYALSPGHLVSLHHGKPAVGLRGWIHTVRWQIECEVIEAYGETIKILCAGPPIPGDSGSAVTDDKGRLFGLLRARPR
jgi:hypothetical protein